MVHALMCLRDWWMVEEEKQELDGIDIAQSSFENSEVGLAI